MVSGEGAALAESKKPASRRNEVGLRGISMLTSNRYRLAHDGRGARHGECRSRLHGGSSKLATRRSLWHVLRVSRLAPGPGSHRCASDGRPSNAPARPSGPATLEARGQPVGVRSSSPRGSKNVVAHGPDTGRGDEQPRPSASRSRSTSAKGARKAWIFGLFTSERPASRWIVGQRTLGQGEHEGAAHLGIGRPCVRRSLIRLAHLVASSLRRPVRPLAPRMA